MASAAKQPHIVYMNLAATGHMNPTLPVVAQLVARGCKVTYFVENTMKAVVEGAGAFWQPFQYPDGCNNFTGFLRNPSDYDNLDPKLLESFGVRPGAPAEEYQFPMSILYNSQLVLPKLVETMQALDPPASAVVYEPLLACALVAAHALKIPAISVFTMPGPGVLAYPDAMVQEAESDDVMAKPRKWIMDQYGFDVLKNGLFMEYYSPQLNIVTTVESLYSPPASETQKQRFGDFTFQCVGVLVDSSVKRIVNAGDGTGAPVIGGSEHADFDSDIEINMTDLKAPLPLQKVQKIKDEGRRIVLISLGTVATGRKWSEPLGMGSYGNAGKPVEYTGKGFMGHTGKEFCIMVYSTCFQVLENDPTIFAIMSLGNKGQEALDELPALPSNVAVRECVPQLELLPLCDAFITHGGANSMHEALSMRVPLAVVPVLGDQMENADSVAKSGAGFSFRHPLKTLTVATLSDALAKLLSPDPNSFRVAASRIAEEMQKAGGVPVVVTAIIERANRNRKG